MVIGAQKSGTTSLAHQLAEHSEICFCDIKEPGYFHQTDNWRAGLDAYHQLFSPRGNQLCGEASTMYTFLPEWQNTYRRLYEYNPDLKFIYMMRQPVERIVSHYSHNTVRNIEKDSPDKAIWDNPVYIDRSRYNVQIRPFIEMFGKDNVHLVVFEEYIADQITVLKQIAAFLGINPAEFLKSDTSPKHKSTGEFYLKSSTLRTFTKSELFRKVRPFMPKDIRQPIRRLFSKKLEQKPEFTPYLKQMIWRFLEDDVAGIEQLLNRSLSVWRQGYGE